MPSIVKNTTFPGLLDLLAPLSCRGCGRMGTPLCDRCKKYIIAHQPSVCPACKSTTKQAKCPKCHDLPPTYIVGERDELIGLLVHDFKFNSVRALAAPLAELANASLPRDINGNSAIVPLPTISRHIRSRGFDHTYLIAKRLAKLRNIPVNKLLLRAKNTVQVGTNRSTRLKQANEAYMLNPKLTPDHETIYILLDDVWTTGASLRAATELLRSAGITQILILVLALSRN